jgi:predicted metal-dependent hydrolase
MISIKTFKKITTVIPNRALKNSIDRFREDKINIIIKKLDILLINKQTKENELQFLQEDLDLTDVKIASIKS